MVKGFGLCLRLLLTRRGSVVGGCMKDKTGGHEAHGRQCGLQARYNADKGMAGPGAELFADVQMPMVERLNDNLTFADN